MIAGVVEDLQAWVHLTIRGPRGRQADVRAIVDTGSMSWLTLPPAVIQATRLTWQGITPGRLADGSDTIFEVYRATVVWDRRRLRIPVLAADAVPLIGMPLLEGYELTMRVRPGGEVIIQRLA